VRVSEGPAAIVSNVPGSFPWTVLHERHPALIARLRDAFPYDPERSRALDRLEAELADGVMTPIDGPSHGAWDTWEPGFLGARWEDAPFLWSECLYFHKVLHATGCLAPGPWRDVDPFEPFKRAELNDPATADELTALDTLLARPAGELAAPLLNASLWGNRADLAFGLTAAPARAAEPAPDLVADDSALLWSLLGAAAPGTVHLIADNAGRELLADLVLIDHLLHAGHAARVVLHIKPYPYYVSDATGSDVLACLRLLRRSQGNVGEAGERLWQATRDGRLAPRTHAFFTAPLPYRDMPADLADELAGGTLTILKGDLNYRRLVEDRHWPATTPFTELTAYFPGPLAALRTLKSDVAAGIAPEVAAALDASDPSWRVNGAHALIQARA
jgi:uncharacterized protein with ATP-grasp and redox domains